MKTLILISLLLTACGQAAQTPTALEASNSLPLTTPVSLPSASPTPSPVASTLSLTYYTVTSTVAPISGETTHTTTMTGYCAVYDTNTYCWDDGEHTISIFSAGLTDNYDFTFFGIGQLNSSGSWTACGGDCDIDDMPTPTMIDSNLTTAIAEPAPGHYAVMEPAQVISTGTPTTVTCSDSAGVLTCGGIVIDTTKTGL